MKLMTMKQYMKMSKPALIRKITKALRAMPKVKLARLCYNITKSKLPRLKTIRQKRLTSRALVTTSSIYPKRRKRARLTKWKKREKRTFSRKQLAAQRLFAKRARAGTLQRRDSGWYKGVRKRRR
jgi:hypothetical protein